MSVLSDSAKAYAQTEGLYVFPLKEHGKTPLTAHGLEDATTDALTIETWWGRWPDANIAIRTGDLVVVDEDHPGALLELAEKQHQQLPQTRIARTGKGRHYYFTQPQGQRIRNTAGKLAPGVDTRGDGGYVVAPPSIHPDGGVYTWESTAPPVPLPPWIAKLLAKPETKNVEPFLGRSTPYGQRALEAELHIVATAIEGTRNDRLNTAAFALGQLIAGNELDEHDAQVSLHAAARACGLPDNEAEQTISSGLAAGLNEPRSAPERNGNAPTTRAALKAVPETDNDSETPVFIDAYEFIAQESDPPLPLWGNDDFAVIAAGGLTLLAGRPGAGKTTWILDLACHLAAGLPYPPTEGEDGPTPWQTPRPLRVALIENEGPQEMFRVKLADKLERFPHDIRALGGSLLVQTWRWGSFSFADIDANEKARQELDAANIDLVIGDPLASLGPEGVGSPADTRAFVKCLRPLGLGTTRAFFFLHHFRERVERTEDELARISGAWGGHLDTLLTLTATHSDDQARLAYPKLRWARKRTPNPVILGRVWNTMSFVSIAEEGDTAILEPVIYEHLATLRAKQGGRNGEGWQTGTEIAKDLERRRVDVKKTLEGAPHLFESRTGEQAKTLGARKSAVLWGLTEWSYTETEPPDAVSAD